MVRKIGVFVSLILFTLGLTGCNRYINQSVQAEGTGSLLLDQQTSLGQTFTARFDGLAGVGVTFIPAAAGTESADGEIVLHLRSDPQSNQDIRSVSLPLQKIFASDNDRFFFDPVPDSNQKDYFLLLENNGTVPISVSIAGSNTYLDGAVYQNGLSQQEQLTFSLKYDTTGLLVGLLKEIPIWLLRLLIGLCLFVLPGWGLLGAIWSGWRERDFWEKIALGSGLSLAIYPVIFLWTYLVGLKLGPLYAWLPPVVGLALILWKNYPTVKTEGGLRKLFSRSNNTSAGANSPQETTPSPIQHFEAIAVKVALIILVGVIIFSRIWVIRSLDFPLWGDSYQHAMIAQLMVENRGLFQSWLPYAELSTFTYHFGFHTLVACYDWISKLPIQDAILWVGQIVNILAVLSLYPLAKKIGRNRWSGVLVLLFAGLVSPMPMGYVNWGRYTQLAGQAILPTAVFFIWRLFQAERLDRRESVISWLIIGGLALTHYRVLIFLLLFYLALIVMSLRSLSISQLVRRVFWSSIGGAIIFLPWLITIAPSSTFHSFIVQITTLPGQALSYLTEYNTLGDPFAFFSPIIWFSLPIIMCWALWQREKDFLIIFLWWYLIFLAANPQLLGLPGAGVLNNFSIQIGFYIPFGIIFSAALARAIDFINSRFIQPGRISLPSNRILNIAKVFVILVLLTSLTISQTRQRFSDVQPLTYSLMTRPDARAMRWIQQNTDPEDRFLVNSFFAYGGTLIAGSDGGWWVPLLTKRLTSQPPLNYGIEEGLQKNSEAQVNDIPEKIKEYGLIAPSVMELLKEHGIGYIYIGQLRGRVNSPGPLMGETTLQNNTHFELVYSQDHVRIYKIIY